MLFHYFTMQKMHYKTDQLETAILMEDVSLDNHDSIEREHDFQFPQDFLYQESVLMLTPSDYKELITLLDGTSPYKTFRGHSKHYWTGKLEKAEHKTVSL